MSTVSNIAAADLREGDTLLIGSSMVSVDSVDVDEFEDDHMWLTVTCVSGNFDQFDEPLRTAAGAVFRVLDAAPRS